MTNKIPQSAKTCASVFGAQAPNPSGAPEGFEVEPAGLEPATSCMPCRRSPS